MNTTTVPIKSELHQALCDNVKARRKELGLTQVEAADLMGMSQSSYNALERGGYQPTIHTIDRLAKVLDINAAVLLQSPATAK